MGQQVTHSRRDLPHISITAKLLAAFGLVVVVVVVLVAVLSRASARREVTRFIRANQTEPPYELVDDLAAHFAHVVPIAPRNVLPRTPHWSM